MNTLRRTLPMYQEMNSLLENFFNPQREDASFIETSTWSPLVDIKEEKDRFVVLADIPGVKKEDIDISLEQHVLTLKGERHFEKSEERNGYTRRERTQGQFYRRFSLPQTADDSKITARYMHGVLEISIPKKEAAAEKKIAITLEE
ncbi:Hsp20/alpha crystallin family protein [Legionella anisa]|uniref:Hsp20/alpha crystallin family protein n=1 Tax=Legionella anisa TaxID=28082 RepID=A0AAX0WW63_9GAMM|nr:Hsp20/alpha crystallin family protein [Legionella anisa]AWN74838.1 Hsp20/alpha crystallin family protein [Legionella anisa]KTC77710.1 heat shock protein, Hsp20 family [Legionella anisa]MBN5936954.1 Hsp20/alpha crystallin family protein [Legionella anisa]MCW8424961.1 Hsp20/alpha crystallin family protein [Legionella anisa]MCW8445919.1 Hsp20/alpha crystallin family protein [Legionella anisa]